MHPHLFPPSGWGGGRDKLRYNKTSHTVSYPNLFTSNFGCHEFSQDSVWIDPEQGGLYCPGLFQTGPGRSEEVVLRAAKAGGKRNGRRALPLLLCSPLGCFFKAGRRQEKDSHSTWRKKGAAVIQIIFLLTFTGWEVAQSLNWNVFTGNRPDGAVRIQISENTWDVGYPSLFHCPWIWHLMTCRLALPWALSPGGSDNIQSCTIRACHRGGEHTCRWKRGQKILTWNPGANSSKIKNHKAQFAKGSTKERNRTAPALRMLIKNVDKNEAYLLQTDSSFEVQVSRQALPQTPCNTSHRARCATLNTTAVCYPES